MWFSVLGWSFTVITILGNSVVVYLIIKRPKLHVTANWFVLSLALADLCVGLSYFPLLFASNVFQELTTNHTGLWFKVSHTFLYSSSANLCTLTADRFFSITMPLKYNLYTTRRRLPILVVTFAWFLPLILFTLPSIFIYSNINESFIFIFETFRVFIFQLFPSVVFIFVIARLCFIAKDTARKEAFILMQIRFNLATQENTKRNNHTEKKSASVKMIMFIISLFVLCHVGGNYRCFCFVFKMCVVPETLKKVIHILFVLNSAFNPLVYAFFKKDMKREIEQMGFVFCRC